METVLHWRLKNASGRRPHRAEQGITSIALAPGPTSTIRWRTKAIKKSFGSHAYKLSVVLIKAPPGIVGAAGCGRVTHRFGLQNEIIPPT